VHTATFPPGEPKSRRSGDTARSFAGIRAHARGLFACKC
jgi:hypothetical protein